MALAISWSSVGDDQTAGVTWVSHGDSPGQDIPIAGMSLFDRLFKRATTPNQAYRIPYPFSDLVAYLRTMVSEESGNPTTVVLVPMGRSLQREAAAPDYFRFPRELVTVTGEPLASFRHNRPVLKSMMFIAHQQQSGQLEVISYNDQAGRFEFQVVDNYTKSSNATVEYASRATCLTCHQNAGPIFSRSPWDETNFNPEVADAISRANPDKFPTMLHALNGEVHKFDIATDYANYFSTAQLIWESGCGIDQPVKPESAQCRGALLNAALQYRLSGDLAFDTQSNMYYSLLVSVVDENWQKLWPGGLLIPSADIAEIVAWWIAYTQCRHSRPGSLCCIRG
jgi:hypothetical protein